MQTGICPKCKLRRILVLKIHKELNDEGTMVNRGQYFAVRNHACGLDLDPNDEQPLAEYIKSNNVVDFVKALNERHKERKLN